MTALPYRFPFTDTLDLFNPKALYVDVIILDPRWAPFTWKEGPNPTQDCSCIPGTVTSSSCEEGMSGCSGYYEVNPCARALRMFTLTNSGGSVSFCNSKIAPDYAQSVVGNPNLTLNPNVTFQCLNATFTDTEAAGNLLWANAIGYFAIIQARVGRVYIRPPTFSGYFSFDPKVDTNVPNTGKGYPTFFVYEVVDNNPERRRTFQALANIVGNLNGNVRILDIPALSNLGNRTPIV